MSNEWVPDKFAPSAKMMKVASAFSTLCSKVVLKPVPLPPSELMVEKVGADVNLRWLDNSPNEKSFSIERRASGVQAFNEVDSTTWNDMDKSKTVAYTDKAPGAGEQTYRVCGKNTNGAGGFSDEVVISV